MLLMMSHLFMILELIPFNSTKCNVEDFKLPFQMIVIAIDQQYQV